MQKLKSYLAVLAFGALLTPVSAQVDYDKLGGWYMYFFDATFSKGPWGVQGDIQYRNWNVMGDLEQLLVRGGVTYSPKNANVKLTLGYGNITTGEYGDGTATVNESRVYQEALFPSKIGSRIYINHRLRYEQRWVENQDFRTRYRYNLFVNIPLNRATIDPKTVYFSFYNEIFINGQEEIGEGREVPIFDRNRTYLALGYKISKSSKVQAGWMHQVTNNGAKNQLQFSLHQKFGGN